MNDRKLADLENVAMVVDSDLFANVNYAIDRKGRGMLILVNKKVIPVAADQVHSFAKEFTAVWDHMRPRTVVR